MHRRSATLYKTVAILTAVAAFTFSSKAQLPAGISITGYADAYLAYYTDSLPAGAFQKFPTYAPRSNSIGLNIAQLSAAWKTEKARALITLHYGDIPASSWSQTFNVIQEANAGIRLSKKAWLDAGFFRTHIGAEGLYPKENITSSLAPVSFFEPYYEAGFKLTYQLSPKLEGRLYLLNGYNLFEDNNRRKSLGMLFTYALDSTVSLVYANYFGDDSPDSLHTGHNRFYNNFCLYYDRRKWRITAGMDFAIQQNADLQSGNKSGIIIGGLFAARYTIDKKLNAYARADFFRDRNGFLSGLYKDAHGIIKGLKTAGATLGMEYKPQANAYIRLEGGLLKVFDDVRIFYQSEAYRDYRYDAILSLGVWF